MGLKNIGSPHRTGRRRQLSAASALVAREGGATAGFDITLDYIRGRACRAKLLPGEGEPKGTSDSIGRLRPQSVEAERMGRWTASSVAEKTVLTSKSGNLSLHAFGDYGDPGLTCCLRLQSIDLGAHDRGELVSRNVVMISWPSLFRRARTRREEQETSGEHGKAHAGIQPEPMTGE